MGKKHGGLRPHEQRAREQAEKAGGMQTAPKQGEPQGQPPEKRSGGKREGKR